MNGPTSMGICRTRSSQKLLAGRAAAVALGFVLLASIVAPGGVLSYGAPASASPLRLGAKAGLSERTVEVSPIQPTSLAVVRGYLYIADPGRQQILKRSPRGVFSVVAGTGVAGRSGDGGPAKHAEIDDPSNLVALSSGSLLFEQAVPDGGSVIREVTSGGLIRTVVGLHPSCAGVAKNAASIPAELATIYGAPLSVDADGSALLSLIRPCSRAHSLGPFLQLTPEGELTNTELDNSGLVRSALVNCGPSASGPGFTVFFCDSGAGHPKELLVLRKESTTKAYPTFGGGALASAGGEVVGVRDDAVVRVLSQSLQTVVPTAALERLVPERNTPTVVALALAVSGDTFMVTDHVTQTGCVAVLSELSSPSARQKVLWSRSSHRCY
jgi:hypothetical protein